MKTSKAGNQSSLGPLSLRVFWRVTRARKAAGSGRAGQASGSWASKLLSGTASRNAGVLAGVLALCVFVWPGGPAYAGPATTPTDTPTPTNTPTDTPTPTNTPLGCVLLQGSGCPAPFNVDGSSICLPRGYLDYDQFQIFQGYDLSNYPGCTYAAWDRRAATRRAARSNVAP